MADENKSSKFNVKIDNFRGNLGDYGTYNENTIPQPTKPAEPEKAPSAPLAPSNPAVTSGGIFISYSRKDTTLVSPVVKRLNDEGFKVWWDQMDLPVGCNWQDELNAALEKSSCLILFVSPDAMKSTFVATEYRYFVNNHKKLYPLMCSPTKLPPELQGVQYIDVNEVDKLIKTLKQHC